MRREKYDPMWLLSLCDGLVKEQTFKFPRLTQWEALRAKEYQQLLASGTPLDRAQQEELTQMYERVFGSLP